MLMIKAPAEDYKSKKVLDYETAKRKISEIKSRNKTVGLCHGGFDLLHPGHIRHLESAKKLCDCLFVSITSDKFVTSRKGPGKPIYPDKLRAYAVAGLEFVDYVVISDFKEGVEVIKRLKPSYYIKGSDFIHKTTPGITAEREAIKSVDGEVRYTTEPNLSTTEIIKYIKEKIPANKLLVVIDRDGTIIKNKDFFGKDDNWREELVMNYAALDFLYDIQLKTNSVKIVVSNQAGVARRLFTCKRVEEINSYINKKLKEKGIVIDDWQYCPYADSKYAELKKGEIEFDPDFMRNKTKRKPSAEMVLDSLKKLGKDIREFTKIFVIGDKLDDKQLADNLNAFFIDVSGKNHADLKKEFNKVLTHS